MPSFTVDHNISDVKLDYMRTLNLFTNYKYVYTYNVNNINMLLN